MTVLVHGQPHQRDFMFVLSCSRQLGHPRHRIERVGQIAYRMVGIMELFQAEQADPEGAEIGRFATLQWHASSCLNANGEEFPARLDFRIVRIADDDAWRLKAFVRIADDDAWRLKAFGGNAPETLACQQGAHAQADFELLLAYALESCSWRTRSKP